MAEEFFKTERGRRFYDRDVPSLITQLKRIADSLEKLTLDQEAKSLQEKKEIKKKLVEAALQEKKEIKKKLVEAASARSKAKNDKA